MKFEFKKGTNKQKEQCIKVYAFTDNNKIYLGDLQEQKNKVIFTYKKEKYILNYLKIDITNISLLTNIATITSDTLILPQIINTIFGGN